MCFSQVYGRIYRVVEPKRARLNEAMTQLEEKQTSLAEAQSKLREVGASAVFTRGSSCQIALKFAFELLITLNGLVFESI